MPTIDDAIAHAESKRDAERFIQPRLAHAYEHQVAHAFPLALVHPDAESYCNDDAHADLHGSSCWGVHRPRSSEPPDNRDSMDSPQERG